jgi:hypothetical protein
VEKARERCKHGLDGRFCSLCNTQDRQPSADRLRSNSPVRRSRQSESADYAFLIAFLQAQSDEWFSPGDLPTRTGVPKANVWKLLKGVEGIERRKTPTKKGYQVRWHRPTPVVKADENR